MNSGEQIIGLAWGLLFPVVVGMLSSGVVLFFYKKTRKSVVQRLESSSVLRTWFRISILLAPLLVGAWADLSDFSEMLEGQFRTVEVVLLSIVSAVTPVYVYLHAINWYNETLLKKEAAGRESLLKEKAAREEAYAEEIDCQRNFLVRLLSHTNANFGKYSQRLEDYARAGTVDPANAISQGNPCREQIRAVAAAVREAYGRIHTIPGDAKIAMVLMTDDKSLLDNGNEIYDGSVSGGFLYPFYSYDGNEDDYFSKDYARFRTYFDLSNPRSSVAVAAVSDGAIMTIEDTEEADGDLDSPFRFFSPEERAQRDQIKSMIAMPFTDNVSNSRWVLCLSCNYKKAFLEKFKWKAEETIGHMQARIRLLLRQDALFQLMTGAVQGSSANTEDADLSDGPTVPKNKRSKK